MGDMASHIETTWDVVLHPDGSSVVTATAMRPVLAPGRYWQAAPDYPWVRVGWWTFRRLRRDLREGERLMRVG